jgi:CO/xanthine dehydrogenase FAD-binding subunit
LYDDFVLGPRRTALVPGEIVVALSIPLPPAGLGSAFRRVTRRRGVDLATLSVACTVDPQGVTRLAYGAVGPRPFLVVDETGVLADPGAAAVDRDRRLAELLERAAPISDIRATRDYRLAMLRVHSRRALASALARQTNGERDGG